MALMRCGCTGILLPDNFCWGKWFETAVVTRWHCTESPKVTHMSPRVSGAYLLSAIDLNQ